MSREISWMSCVHVRRQQTYRTMTVDNHVDHPGDIRQLLKGAVFISLVSKYSYDQETKITEHRYQLIKYKDTDGRIKCGYFSINGDDPIIVYLDNEVLDVKHICCMAHVRAKFKYAAEIEHDENASLFLTWFGRLYGMEETYEKLQLSPQEIKFFRNSEETWAIKLLMRRKLDEMLSASAPKHGDLMRRAVVYFDHFWTQVFRYRHDGEYTIDNNLAERFIRPLANERKNSLFFGSHKMARKCGISLRHIHMQISGNIHIGISQEILQ